MAMCGKSSAVSELPSALQRGAEQHAGQLADVARPAVAHQHRQRVIADRQRAHARLLGEAGQQVADQRRNVAAAIAQRRNGDGRRRNPLGQARMEILGQRPARGRDQPDIDRVGAVAADRADLAGGEHAVELLLGFLRQGADLVEQQRAAVGLDHPADALGEGARKGARHMAEQLAVDDVGRDRLAVDLDQRPAGAQAGVMDGAGEGFLAAAGFADDQDRQAVARRLGGDRQRGTKIGRGADQLVERSGRARSFPTAGRARQSRGGGRHGRPAPPSAARERSAWRDSRTLRRASPRPPARPNRRRRAR